MLITVNTAEGTQAQVTGHKIGRNQYQIYISGGEVLVSYTQPVAAILKGCFYKTDAFWSATTQRHIRQWQAVKGRTPAAGLPLPEKSLTQYHLYRLVKTLVGEPIPKLP
jgi:hypothetical protein